jgi:opacity protein-like surface antigen
MTRVWIAVSALLLMSAVARADDEEEDTSAKTTEVDDEEPVKKGGKKAKPKPPDDEEPTGDTASASVSASTGDLVTAGSPKARMTLPGGKAMFNVIGEANMGKKAVGKPLSIAPDLWFGLHDRLTFGIYHSGRAATGFLSGFGTGLCFRGGGDMGACALGLGDVYTFAGSEARIGLTEGGFAVALVLGGQARAFDPKLVLSGKGGFIARINSKRLAIELAPMAFIGLTQRKVGGMDFNQDEIAVPLTIYLRFASSFSLALQGGITSTLKKFGDNYRIPAAAGIAWWVTPHFSIDVAFGLAAVADKDDMTKAFDQRSATLGVGYAL